MYIEFIIEQLRSGNLGFKDVFRLFKPKFNTSELTFNKYWKIANAEFAEQQKKINELKEDSYLRNEIERSKKIELDRDKVIDMQANVLKIIYNKLISDKNSPNSNDINAFNSTVDRYSKLLGMDSSTKNETKLTLDSDFILNLIPKDDNGFEEK